MLDPETRLTTMRQGTAGLRKSLLKQAVTEYSRVISSGDSTRSNHHATAVTRVQALLKKRLFSPDCLRVLDNTQAKDSHWVNALALAFDAASLPLAIAAPTSTFSPRLMPVAVAGAVGAAAGMMIVTPLAKWTLDMRDLGLALGGPIGAFLVIVLYWRLSRSRVVQWITGRMSPGRVDVGLQQAVARLAIEQWLDMSLVILTLLCEFASHHVSGQAESHQILRELSRKIYALHHASQDGLAVTADEVIQAARNLGFEGLDGQPEFMASARGACETLVWQASLAGQYEVFGHITDGDSVRVERKPVVLEGRMMSRGLVRKVRK
ncbi:MAG: hypothetical protein GY809_20955 [Planctomycetes bacterium]|nr:hypothetical protein [Planctomycetota bacterium]